MHVSLCGGIAVSAFLGAEGVFHQCGNVQARVDAYQCLHLPSVWTIHPNLFYSNLTRYLSLRLTSPAACQLEPMLHHWEQPVQSECAPPLETTLMNVMFDVCTFGPVAGRCMCGTEAVPGYL